MAKDKTPPVVPEHTSTDAAFEQIHKANRGIAVATIITLVLIVAMLGVALLQLNRLVKSQQTEIETLAQNNRAILQRLEKDADTHARGTQAAHDDISFLICEIIRNTTSPTEGMLRVCEDIEPGDPNAPLRSGGRQGFLAPGSTEAATTTNGQPATGGGAPSFDNNTNTPAGGTPPSSGPTDIPIQTPAPNSPGLVETTNPQASDTLCTAQQLFTNGCIIR